MLSTTFEIEDWPLYLHSASSESVETRAFGGYYLPMKAIKHSKDPNKVLNALLG